MLAPWVARNLVVFHRLTLATDANTLIAGANCHDTYDGHDIGWWSLECLARGRTRPQLLAGDASTSAAFDYASDHVPRLPLVAAVRVLRTFDFFQPLRQGNHEPRRRWVDVLGPSSTTRCCCSRAWGSRACASAGGCYWLQMWMVVIVSALGWGIGRFRVAADVSLLVLAALAIVAHQHRGALSPSAAGDPSRPPAPARAG